MAATLYHALDGNEIRLLQLKSAEHLTFEIVHISLLKPKPFTALSYTWGAPARPVHITINGLVVSVTQNLYDALSVITLHCTRQGATNGPVYFWVDAVCINQQDIQERSSQVKLMRDIYEKASSIFIWLGRPSREENAVLAVQLLQYLEKQMHTAFRKNRPYRPWWWPKLKQPPDDLASFLDRVPLEDSQVFGPEGSTAHSAWTGIRDICQSPWWTRTWIRQEATVPESMKIRFIAGTKVFHPETKITFFHGSQTFTWSQLCYTARVAGVWQADYRLKGLIPNVEAAEASLEALRLQRSVNSRISLLDALTIFRPSVCTDPRDKIYAPLNIVSDHSTGGVMVNPDYSKSFKEACIDVVDYQLRQAGQELDFLGYVYVGPNLSTENTPWPSWLPDWSRREEHFAIPKFLYTQPKLEGRAIKPVARSSTRWIDGSSRTRAFNASNGLHATATREGAELHIRVILCEVIQEMISGFKGVPSSHQELVIWEQDAQHKYWTGENWQEALLRTCTLDVQYSSRKQPVTRGGGPDLSHSSTASTAARTDTQRVRMAHDSNVAAATALVNRTLCRTQTGSLAMVPRNAKPVDLLCVITGSQVMHVLRHADTMAGRAAYTYIGEAYVHGLMDGLCVERMRQGIYESELAVLV